MIRPMPRRENRTQRWKLVISRRFQSAGRIVFGALQIITTCNEGRMPLSGMRKLLLSDQPHEHRSPWLERRD